MRHERPCAIIPTVQIDLWGKKAGAERQSVDTLARTLFQEHLRLVCWALLRAHCATTVNKIAACIRMARQSLEPRVCNGQVYLSANWRIRWEDMTPALHDLVLNIEPHSPHELLRALCVYYDSESVTSCILAIVGPARAAGTRAALR